MLFLPLGMVSALIMISYPHHVSFWFFQTPGEDDDGELVSKEMDVRVQRAIKAEEGCETSEGLAKGNITQHPEHGDHAGSEHEEQRGNRPMEEERSLLRDGDVFPPHGIAASGANIDPEDGPRACVRCGKHFGSHALLVTHLTSRKRSFACPLCGKGFDFYASCVGHLKGIHNDFDRRPKCLNTLNTCSVCPSHEKTGSDKLHCRKKLHCLECGQHFDHKVDFAAHQNEHRKGMVCIDCGKTFQFRSSLARHWVHCKARVLKPPCADSGSFDSAVSMVFKSCIVTFK